MTKVLGIRTAPSVVRYAILVKNDNGTIDFVNANSENKIDFPADCHTAIQKLPWLSNEVGRIFRQNPDISHVLIKASEFGRGRESAASREAAYYDAAIITQVGLLSTPIQIDVRLYRGLGANIKRENVKSIAENYIGRTEKYWNEQMADAVVAAFCCFKEI